jgi:hypothetical protein
MPGSRLPVGRRCWIAALTSSSPRAVFPFDLIALDPL